MLNILSYFCLFLLLFDLQIPLIKGVGSAPVSALISLYIISRKAEKGNLGKVLYTYRYLVLIYILILLYVLLRIFFNGAEEPSYIASSLKTTAIMLATLLYISAFPQQELFKKLINIFFTNGAIALFVGTFQEYQYIIDFFKAGTTELIGYTPYRNAFLAGSGYFGIGAAYGLALPFFLVYTLETKKYYSLSEILKFSIIFLSGIFAARTVFLCVFIAIFYLIFVKRKISIMFYSLIVLILGYFVINLEIFLPHKMWLLEFFQSGTETSSINILLSEHLKLPTRAVTYIFGDAYYISSDGGYYQGTDIGYMRNLYFGGIIFILLVLFIPLSLYWVNKSTMMLFLIIPVCLLLHFKGVFLYNSPAGAPLLILISHIFYSKVKVG